jgi:hypothetical protein
MRERSASPNNPADPSCESVAVLIGAVGPGGAMKCSHGRSEAEPVVEGIVHHTVPEGQRRLGGKSYTSSAPPGQVQPAPVPRVPLRSTRGYIPWPSGPKHPRDAKQNGRPVLRWAGRLLTLTYPIKCDQTEPGLVGPESVSCLRRDRGDTPRL